jgi:uncharacterized metal-binding protein
MAKSKATPIVYACSGGCSTGQLANYVALCLDRARIAKMSSIAGVGGGVPAMVSVARSGRPIVAIDGCQRYCARRCLARHGVLPDKHYAITDFDIRKRERPEFDESEAVMVYQHIRIALTD